MKQYIFLILLLAKADISSYGEEQVSQNVLTYPTDVTGNLNATDDYAEDGNECKSSIFPCSNKILGNCLLITFYGITLGLAAKLISDGAELLLDLGLSAALIGGVVLPVFGAVPDSFMILVSGLGERDKAQQQISVGMGTLAGSTVLLLTIAWAVSLLVGRVDLLRDGDTVVGLDKTCTSFSFTKQGIEINESIQTIAKIMLLTALPYLIVQSSDWYFGATLLNVQQPQYVRIAALITMSLCFIGFFCYLSFQFKMARDVGSARIVRYQDRKKRQLMANAAKAFYFTGIKSDNKETMTPDERESLVRKKYFTTWKFQAKANQTEKEYGALEDESSSPEELSACSQEENAEQPRWKICLKCALELSIGVGVVTIFSDPMCDALSELTNEKNKEYIPLNPFYVSFVITPLCSNASELVSSIIFAMHKEKEDLILTYSQLYGAAIMNNTLCLGVFTALIYFGHLEWYFSAEVTAILLIEVILGIVALTFKKIYYVALTIPIALLYVLSLAIVAFLEKFLHWG